MESCKGKTIITAAISGFIALTCGVLLGIVLHRTMGASDPQIACSHLEEQVTLAVGTDNRQHPPQQQIEALSLVVGERLIDAARAYSSVDILSQERIQRNVERILHAGVLDRIPYADRRAASLGHALCLCEFANDEDGLESCLDRTAHIQDANSLSSSLVLLQ